MKTPHPGLKIWVGEGNVIFYTFFEKLTNSYQMMHRQTALSENTKMATINSEILRRMLNYFQYKREYLFLTRCHRNCTTLDIACLRSGGARWEP